MYKNREKLLEIKDLKKHFAMGRNTILKAVDGITFDIYRGETFGLVGRVRLWKIHCRQNNHGAV